MGSGRPPGSDLPAPYESPWRRLWQDLRAVSASLWLRGWELLRLNRQAQLWRPRFWPEGLASIFWPVLLGGILVLALAVVARLVRPQPLPAGLGAVAEQAGPLVAATPPDPLPPERGMPRSEAADPVPEAGPAPAEESLPAPATILPLLQALADTAGSDLIRDARAEPARALLVLQVDAAYGRLPAAQRADQARGWWQRAQELGYGRFELLGPGNGLLARSAVVGGGLVLYEPPTTLGDDPA
ncbi:MAG: hypothetical protein ACKOZW_14150 [Cyanobium sp.]